MLFLTMAIPPPSWLIFLDVCDVRVLFDVNVTEKDITNLPGYSFEKSGVEPQNNRECMFRVRDKNSFLAINF